MTDAALQSRVWRAVEACADPAAVSAGLLAFLPVATFRVDRKVPTARIRRAGERLSVEFGSDFLRDQLADDRDFLFVLLHEIYHHLLGHLRVRPGDRLSQRCPGAANLAADMLVNRAVTGRYFPDGVPLLNRLYGDRLPACLLKPLGPVDIARTPGGLAGLRRRFLARSQAHGVPLDTTRWAWVVYRMAWIDGAPYEGVLTRLIDLLEALGMVAVRNVPLLGDHPGDGLDGLPWDDAAFDGGPLQHGMAAPGPALDEAPLVSALRNALLRDPSRTASDRRAEAGVVVSPGRSDLAFLAAGLPVLLYHGPRTLPCDGRSAHVYVDVSGSVSDSIGSVFAALDGLRDLVADPLHAFSTVVTDCTRDQLATGTFRTTGGTDFTPVLAHAQDAGHKQIVLITDGRGRLDPDTAEAFRASGAGLHLVLTDAGRRGGLRLGLAELARSIGVLDDLERGGVR